MVSLQQAGPYDNFQLVHARTLHLVQVARLCALDCVVHPGQQRILLLLDAPHSGG